jgi:heme exporter protein D
MQTADHMGFIVAAYAVTVVIVGALIAWVMLDYRAQQRALAELDKRGIGRRSAVGRGNEQAMAQAKEQAKQQA